MNYLGFHGPYLLSFITAVSILNRTPYLVAFVVGGFVNSWVNVYLKMFFREPRPYAIDLKKMQKMDIFSMVFTQDIHEAHKYGMPSGHAQIGSFAVGFWWLLYEKKIREGRLWETTMFIGMMALLANTLGQRWESGAHTSGQLAMGVFVGGIFAWLVIVSTKYILCHRVIISNSKKLELL